MPIRRLLETGFVLPVGLLDKDFQTSPEILISVHQIREWLLFAAWKGIRLMREQDKVMVRNAKARGMRKLHFTFRQQGDNRPELPDLMCQDAGNAPIMTAVFRGKQSMESVEQTVFRREDGSEATRDGFQHCGHGSEAERQALHQCGGVSG